MNTGPEYVGDPKQCDSQFIARSKRYTRYVNANGAGRLLVICLAPWVQAAAFGKSVPERRILVICMFFTILCVLCVMEQMAWTAKRRCARRMAFNLLGTLPSLVVL